ncbi:molybdopterin dinucleotide binding domain-containing protein [Amycolatopsis sp. CM201R]|uniref:molybdopterin dinucleotide binding domain-containing protein n=1 Tax=Amycolatopsis sp. CM201R TaxID=2761537 RepID=UPI0037C0A41E
MADELLPAAAAAAGPAAGHARRGRDLHAAGCHRAAKTMTVPVQRALGSSATGPQLGEELFERVLAGPTPFSAHEQDEVWSLMRRERVQLAVPDLLDWLAALDPAAEQPDPAYPFSLLNGQRRAHNANQILRDPRWRRTDPDGALRARPEELASIGASPGDWVAVVTPAGRVVVRAEADPALRPGQLALPHGYGMAHPAADGRRVVSGPRINLLTDALDRDPIAGTPHHKDVPARLEPATEEERARAEADSESVASGRSGRFAGL